MITIKHNNNCIEVQGHANYAEPGTDIVCSAVSALAQTLVASLEKLTDDLIGYHAQPGFVKIIIGNLSDRGKTLIDSFFIGIEMIADEYPENVRVER